jgi:hypothetical protein
MLETSRVTAELEAARAFADTIGLRVQLETRLAYLAAYAAPRRTRCVLYPDRAPYSFAFAMERETRRDEWSPWFRGALVYHGPSDRHGSGDEPTSSVTATPTMGWAVRT